MNKKWKVILIALITALALAMPLAAQTEAPSPQSNASKATLTNFGGDVDNFFHLHNWGNVEFNKYFSYAGFRNAGAFDGYELDIGYARRFGSIYLSAFYEGQITERGTASSYTSDSTVTTYGLNGGIYEEDRNVNTITNGSGSVNIDPPYINNNIGVLVGIGSMGIKAGFYETLRSTDKYTSDLFNATTDDYGTTTQATQITETSAGLKTLTRDVTDYKYLAGTMLPYLHWGMKLNVASLVIKPKVEIGLGIVAKKETYSFAGTNTTISSGNNVTENGTAVGTHTSGESYTDNGYLFLGAKLGADVNFPAKDNQRFTAGLSYAITPRIYSRSYENASGDEKVAGTVSAVNYTQNTVDNTTGTTTSVTGSIVTATEKSYLRHSITPTLRYANDLSDQVSLGINGKVDFGFGTGTNGNSSGKKTTTTLRTVKAHNGDPAASYTETKIKEEYPTTSNQDISQFSVTSSIGAGIKWAIKPDRFTINAGLSITLPSYTSTTTHTLPVPATIEKTETVYEDGSKTSASDITTTGGNITTTDTTTVQEAWGALAANWSLGGVFSFTPNFAVDMYIHSGSGILDNNQAFATLNLDQIQYSMLFTLKY
jgi:hypothetical protein